MQAAAERLDPESAARPATAELRLHRFAAAAVHDERQDRVEPSTEGIEGDVAARVSPHAELHAAAECVDVDRPRVAPARFVDLDRSAEGVRLHGADGIA